MWVLRIVKVFNRWCAVAVESYGTIDFLPNGYLLGDCLSTVGALVTDLIVGKAQWLRLANGQSPWSGVRHRYVRAHGSVYWRRTVTLENLAVADSTIDMRFRVRKSLSWSNWTSACLGSIVIINFRGNSVCRKWNTIWYLSHRPIILCNFWPSCILAFDTYGLDESSIDVLLRRNFASRIYDKVSSRVSWGTSLNFQRATSNSSAYIYGAILICKENRISGGDYFFGTGIKIIVTLVRMLSWLIFSC